MSAFLHDLDWVLPLRNGFLTPIFEAFTALGYPVFFFVALPILYWAWDKEAGNRVAVLLLASALVNYYFKDLFQDPRPDPTLRMDGHAPTSFGLPSGHTQLAIVFWGAIALEIKKRWAWITATIFIIGIAFSRLYLGVHDVEDVLGGIILGGISLACLKLSFRIFVGFVALEFGFLCFGFWPPYGSGIPDFPPPKVIAVFGFFIGWIIGTLYLKKLLPPASPKSVRQRLLAVLVGFPLFGGFLAILKFLFEAIGFYPAAAFSLGAVLAGTTVTWAVPAILTKLKIYTKDTQTSQSTEPAGPA